MADGAARVMLVEDDRFLRRAAEGALRQAGFAVVMAGDGEEALELARAAPPDLVLLDVIMPRLQGFDVLMALKRDPGTASVPVIMLSNLGQEEDIRRAMDAGAAGYLVKANLSLQALVAHVRDALARRASGGEPPAHEAV